MRRLKGFVSRSTPWATAATARAKAANTMGFIFRKLTTKGLALVPFLIGLMGWNTEQLAITALANNEPHLLPRQHCCTK